MLGAQAGEEEEEGARQRGCASLATSRHIEFFPLSGHTGTLKDAKSFSLLSPNCLSLKGGHVTPALQ